MKKDLKNIIIISLISFFLLVFNMFVKNQHIIYAESIYASFMMVITFLSINFFGFQKDRETFAKKDIFNKTIQVLIIYFLIIYLLGLYFGYSKIPFSLKPKSIINNIFSPIIIYTFIELFRYVVINNNKNNKKIMILYSVVIGIIELSITIRVLHFENIIVTFNMFADYILPVAIKQLCLGYICYHGGLKPIILYRMIMIIYTYIIPIQPTFSKAILCVCNILLPMLLLVKIKEIIDEQKEEKIYIPVDSNTISKKQYAMIIALIIVLISGISPIGITAIASDSMHPTFSKGAGVITIEVKQESLKKGDIISFNKDNKTYVHRIEKIEQTEGNIKYYTKGDLNHTMDEGYITYEDVNSKVLFSVPLIGYPSLIISELLSL